MWREINAVGARIPVDNNELDVDRTSDNDDELDAGDNGPVGVGVSKMTMSLVL